MYLHFKIAKQRWILMRHRWCQRKDFRVLDFGKLKTGAYFIQIIKWEFLLVPVIEE
jgi:hypothetical protein